MPPPPAAAEGPLLVPSPVLGEIGYLLQSRAGPQAEVTFLRSSGGDGFKVAGLQGTGTGRMAGLAEPYLDLPPGIVDAAVAARVVRAIAAMAAWSPCDRAVVADRGDA